MKEHADLFEMLKAIAEMPKELQEKALENIVTYTQGMAAMLRIAQREKTA